MKLQGILGGGTGKLGESVFTNNAGRTIVRQYNPHVRNPRTARQQNSRGRFTVASELAKEFALALKIGMPRIGALTSRNRFTSMVIPTSAGVITLSGSTLSADYTKVPLSKGGMPTPDVHQARVDEANSKIIVELDSTEGYDPEAAGYVPPMSGHAGCVLVLVGANGTYVFQKSFGSTNQIEFTGIGVNTLQPEHAYVFAKWVPDAYNDITTDTMPWKFPSDQSATVYATLN